MIFLDACNKDIHATKYSKGHDIFVKMLKNAGGCWQFILNFFIKLVGKELTCVITMKKKSLLIF